MSIQSFSIQDGATGFTVTAGTSKTFSIDGQPVQGGIHVSDASNTDFKSRLNATFKSKLPQRQQNGSYSKGRNTIICSVPYVKTDGTVDLSIHRYEGDYTVDIPAATVKNGRFLLAQMMFDSEIETFHTSGSQA